ncbi:MAG TPA: ATP-binding protein [Verrucomicrobiae bacterium]|nr:ATP-binding protein [Verrucomicrobiae bacterium]
MNLNSFRLKMALWSGLITAALLLGSGFVLWRISYRFNLDRLDREIRNLGQANLDRVQGGEHWIRLADALKFIAGDRESARFIIWVKNYDKVVYQSPDWPADIVPEKFSVPEKFEGPNAPRPGEPLPPPPRRGEQISPKNPALPLKTPESFTRNAAGKTWRIAVMGNPYVTLVLAADMGEFNDRMAQLRNTYLVTLVAVLVLIAGSSWFVARRALRPVNALTQTAEKVTAHGLDQRIPSMPREPEFNRLITVFNEMLARLEKSFQQATRFSADASHELKTPLARLQVELEQALQITPPESPQQEIFSSLLDEVCRLKAIVHKLLLLALADAGQLRLKLEPVNLRRLMENVAEDCEAQAPHLTVEKVLAPDVRVHADPDLLEQALQNLANNAVKYNRLNGSIRFELQREAGRIQLRVVNAGPGIPPADQARIFERFFRVDQSRSQQVEGTGLGLGLAREIIRAHGGELALETSNNEFTCFRITLEPFKDPP